MKLTRKLSRNEFIVSHTLILFTGLSFIFGLYYILNLQYPVVSKPFEKGPVTSAPKTLRLEVEQPDHDILSYESSIIVSGKIAPSEEVLIFSDTKDLIIKSDIRGSFSTVFNLNEGINHLRIAVFDATGDKKADERVVYYSKEKLE